MHKLLIKSLSLLLVLTLLIFDIQVNLDHFSNAKSDRNDLVTIELNNDLILESQAMGATATLTVWILGTLFASAVTSIGVNLVPVVVDAWSNYINNQPQLKQSTDQWLKESGQENTTGSVVLPKELLEQANESINGFLNQIYPDNISSILYNGQKLSIPAGVGTYSFDNIEYLGLKNAGETGTYFLTTSFKVLNPIKYINNDANGFTYEIYFNNSFIGYGNAFIGYDVDRFDEFDLTAIYPTIKYYTYLGRSPLNPAITYSYIENSLSETIKTLSQVAYNVFSSRENAITGSNPIILTDIYNPANSTIGNDDYITSFIPAIGSTPIIFEKDTNGRTKYLDNTYIDPYFKTNIYEKPEIVESTIALGGTGPIGLTEDEANTILGTTGSILIAGTIGSLTNAIPRVLTGEDVNVDVPKFPKLTLPSNLDILGILSGLWSYLLALFQWLIATLLYALLMVLKFLVLIGFVLSLGTDFVKWLFDIFSLFINLIVTWIINNFLQNLTLLLTKIMTITRILPSPLKEIADLTLTFAGGLTSIKIIQTFMNMRKV